MTHPTSHTPPIVAALAAMLLLSWLPAATRAADASPAPATAGSGLATRKIAEYRSPSLVVRTDLPPEAARQMQARLEATLDRAVAYWRKPLADRIDCYLVDRQANWSDPQLPHRLTRIIVGGVRGATVPRQLGRGGKSRNDPVVIACCEPGVAEHEVVHAYCIKALGSTGPEWYSEGMAELIARGVWDDAALPCSPEQVQLLRSASERGLDAVLNRCPAGERLYQSFQRCLGDKRFGKLPVPLTEWTPGDSHNYDEARANCLQRVVLCHLLANNPNYRAAFQAIEADFQQGWESGLPRGLQGRRERLLFELTFMQRHAAPGYRVDLCWWEWDQPSRLAHDHRPHAATVLARRGFQSAQLVVSPGQQFQISAAGQWRTAADRPAVSIGGDTAGRGRLQGVLLNEYSLSEPFFLDDQSRWTAAANGVLYLRCDDAWHELADNDGQVTVTFRYVE